MMHPGCSELHQQGAAIRIEELDGARRRVEVRALTSSVPIAKPTCETTYPLELIRAILDVKGPSHLCDEIARDEDPAYVRRSLEHELLAFVGREAFDGKRVLDFGCGSGASTMVLARMFPKSELVGIELLESYLSIAKLRAAHYGLPNIAFFPMPGGTQLPAGVGQFDFIVLSAVYEHLLPQERRLVMPRLWAVLKPGGILFVNQTPYRYFPIESHTTGLPALNYLPDWLALAVARRLSKKIAPDESWESLLRRGIRGGTEREIARLLGRGAAALAPVQCGKDNIDLWFSELSPKFRGVKRIIRLALKGVRRVSGVSLLPQLSLAFRKAE